MLFEVLLGRQQQQQSGHQRLIIFQPPEKPALADVSKIVFFVSFREPEKKTLGLCIVSQTLNVW